MAKIRKEILKIAGACSSVSCTALFPSLFSGFVLEFFGLLAQSFFNCLLSSIPFCAAYFRTSSVIFMLHPPSLKLRRDRIRLHQDYGAIKSAGHT
jgi:hypothetical protein